MSSNRLDINSIKYTQVQFEDPFFDSYSHENYLCHDILDKVALIDGELAHLTIDKHFLERLVRSHILFIKAMESE